MKRLAILFLLMIVSIEKAQASKQQIHQITGYINIPIQYAKSMLAKTTLANNKQPFYIKSCNQGTAKCNLMARSGQVYQIGYNSIINDNVGAIIGINAAQFASLQQGSMEATQVISALMAGMWAVNKINSMYAVMTIPQAKKFFAMPTAPEMTKAYIGCDTQGCKIYRKASSPMNIGTQWQAFHGAIILAKTSELSTSLYVTVGANIKKLNRQFIFKAISSAMSHYRNAMTPDATGAVAGAAMGRGPREAGGNREARGAGGNRGARGAGIAMINSKLMAIDSKLDQKLEQILAKLNNMMAHNPNGGGAMSSGAMSSGAMNSDMDSDIDGDIGTGGGAMNSDMDSDIDGDIDTGGGAMNGDMDSDIDGDIDTGGGAMNGDMDSDIDGDIGTGGGAMNGDMDSDTDGDIGTGGGAMNGDMDSDTDSDIDW